MIDQAPTPMELLANWTIQHGEAERKIELLQGDLSRLPGEHAVDVLIVSAYPDDYRATERSLIGALDRAGLSVRELSGNKQADLRKPYSCWLSKPVDPEFNFRHILCVEFEWQGVEAAEITDNLFRALAPYLLSDLPNSSVAMSLIGTGDMGRPAEEMLTATLQAAVGWIGRGLPLRVLKIVVKGDEAAKNARAAFVAFRDRHQTSKIPPARAKDETSSPEYDVFMSYSRRQEEMARFAVAELSNRAAHLRVFYDRTNLRAGQSWLDQISEVLDSSRRVVAMYSPEYWASENCKDEFLGAYARQKDTGATILFPIYLSEAKMPYMFASLQYVDCRVNDKSAVAQACAILAQELA